MRTKKIKVAPYIRTAQKDDYAINMQKKLIEEKLEKLNYVEITDYYIDNGYSGVTFERPAFKKLIERLESDNNDIDVVIVTDIARITREPILFTDYYKKYFNSNNVSLVTIDGIMLEFLCFFQEIETVYRKDQREKIRIGINHKNNLS